MYNQIVKIKVINDAIFVFPKEAKNEYQHIYRSASGVYWNKNDNCFFANEPDKWTVDSFFNRLISIVYDECRFLLQLTDKTILENVSEKNLFKIIEIYSLYQTKYCDEFEFVYVEDDGSIRELRLSEKIYLRTKYSGGDGARPYIKPNYKYLTPDNKMSGYILRKKIGSREINIGGVFKMDNYIDELKQLLFLGYEIDYTNIEYLKLIKFA